MQEKEKLIEQIEKFGRRAKGRTPLLNYLKGKKIRPTKAILAKCYECVGYYVDGIQDCRIKHCPLYPFNPYNKGD